jgi:AraC family carnitine catabolism transcriptional activator
VANRESSHQIYQWRLLSVEGGNVASSSGLELSTDTLDENRSDVVLLLSSYHPEAALVTPLLRWLKHRAQNGALMGCVDTGAFIFAQAGLLFHTPASVHFEALRGYQEQFKNRLFIDRLFDVSEQRCSSAGGVATLDMTLGLIERFSGGDLAARVAEILTYRPLGITGQQQKMIAETALVRMDRTLAKAVDLMISSLDSPIPIALIAKRSGTETWHLNRLFKRHLERTPSQYYLALRLSQASNLLRNSHLQIGQIASLCGFDNQESFARAFKKHFGSTASIHRSTQSPVGRD